MGGGVEMYIIDRVEHGNGGVCNFDILDKLTLSEALKKSPRDYGIYSKEWGFWPVICRGKDANKPSYYWDEDSETWNKVINVKAHKISLKAVNHG